MSTQDSIDEKYFVRLAEILFLGSEEVLERAVSLVSRIHCLQDWWWPREESASILLFACCPLFSFHFSFFKRRISIDRGSEEDSQYWFGEKVFLSQVSRSPKRKFLTKVFWRKKFFWVKYLAPGDEGLSGFCGCLIVRWSRVIQSQRRRHSHQIKKGLTHLLNQNTHIHHLQKEQRRVFDHLFLIKITMSNVYKVWSRLCPFDGSKKWDKDGGQDSDALLAISWEAAREDDGTQTKLLWRISYSLPRFVPKKRCFCYTLISPIFSFFCLSFAKRRFTKMAQ